MEKDLTEGLENFKKEISHSNQELHEFMSEYINLEDKILEKFDESNVFNREYF